MSLSHLASYADYRAAAARRLPKVMFDYVDGGAYDEVTLARNVEAVRRVTLRQRVMQDMSRTATGVSLFGQQLSMPLILAPVGFAGMLARRGEAQAARAAKAAGVPFCLSTVGVCPIEEVKAAAGVAPWYQLYMVKDRGAVRALLERVQTAGAPVLVVTVDLPTPGTRYRDQRNGFNRTPGQGGGFSRALDGLKHPGWLWDVYLRGRPLAFGNLSAISPDVAQLSAAWNWIKTNFDPSVTWRDLDFIRAHWKGPIVVKGVLDAEDAKAAASAGADGLIVSNHGGRQLDGAISGFEALPRVVEAAGGKMSILVDGGIRSGLDVLKAVALGAKACLAGRPWAFALSAGGEAGVRQWLGAVASELKLAMVMTGCRDITAAGPELLERG